MLHDSGADKSLLDTSGMTIRNQVGLTYSDFHQLTTDAQNHSGPVVSGTLSVGYGYEDGSANNVRLKSIKYRITSARQFDYGTLNTIDDKLSRVAKLVKSSTSPVEYTRLGLNQIVQISNPTPRITMSFIASTSGGDGDEIYRGLNRQRQPVDVRWTKSTTDLERMKFGYRIPFRGVVPTRP